MRVIPGGGDDRDWSGEDGPAGRYGPPPMIGGYVAGPTVMGRSDRAVVAARQVLAYPDGVEVEVEAHVRGASSGSMAGAADADSDPRSQLRFRLRFASGTEMAQAHTGELGDELVPVPVPMPMPESGPMPALTDIGGESSWGAAGGGGDARVRLWIWPLPAPGPAASAGATVGVGSGTLTLLCSWPQHGLSDAGLVLGVDAIRDAALRAQPFWPQRS